ncbi:hypothetical protein D3C84_860080 [compost metagenome]
MNHQALPDHRFAVEDRVLGLCCREILCDHAQQHRVNSGTDVLFQVSDVYRDSQIQQLQTPDVSAGGTIGDKPVRQCHRRGDVLLIAGAEVEFATERRECRRGHCCTRLGFRIDPNQ